MKQIPTEDTLSEDQAREYFIDLILGLEYCESPGRERKGGSYQSEGGKERGREGEEVK